MAITESGQKADIMEDDDETPEWHQVVTLRGHKRGVTCVKFSPSGSLLASASADASIRVWSVDHHGPKRRSSTSSAEDMHVDHQYKDANSLGYAPEGTPLYGHDRGINDAAWAPDSRHIISASDDTQLILWDVEKKASISTFSGHRAYVMCCDVNCHGNLVVSGSFDETMRLWDTRTGKCIKVVQAHSEEINSVNFCADGSMVVSGSTDGLIRIWDTSTRQCLKSLIDRDNPPVGHVKFSPNGKFLLSSTIDNSVKLWRLDTPTPKPVKRFVGHKNEKFCVNPHFSFHTGQPSILCGSEDSRIFQWDMQTQEITQRLSCHTATPIGLDCHPTRRLLASGAVDHDKTVLLWEFKRLFD